MRNVIKIKRAGTVKLLQLTKDLNKEDQYELLKYIGYLEQSEDRLARQIEIFYNSVSWIEKQ